MTLRLTHDPPSSSSFSSTSTHHSSPSFSEDATGPVTLLSVSGNTLAEVRASPLGPPMPLDPHAHLAPLSSPFVRLWDLRASSHSGGSAPMPYARIDLGGHALRAVTGLHLSSGALSLTHGHVYRPSPIATARWRAGRHSLMQPGASGGVLSPASLAAAAPAQRPPLLGHWNAAARRSAAAAAAIAAAAPVGEQSEQILRIPAPPREPRLCHLMALASEESGRSMQRGDGGGRVSGIDLLVIPEYAYPKGHAPERGRGSHSHGKNDAREPSRCASAIAWPPASGHMHHKRVHVCSLACSEGLTDSEDEGERGDASRLSSKAAGRRDADAVVSSALGGAIAPPHVHPLPPLDGEMWAMSVWQPATLTCCGWVPLPTATCLGGGVSSGGGGASILAVGGEQGFTYWHREGSGGSTHSGGGGGRRRARE